MNKHLARELIKSRKAVRDKYQSLKLASSAVQSQLEQSYKPITEPLQELISKIKTEPLQLKEETIDLPKKYLEKFSSTPKKSQRKTPVLPYEQPSFFDSEMASSSRFPLETSIINESSPSTTLENLNLSDILEQTKQSIQTYIDTPAYQDWLHDFDVLPRQYIDAGVKDVENKFDHNYGIVHDLENEKMYLGLTQKPVEIVGKDIKVEGITYPGTTGLYELLFKKDPVGYKPEDLENYMDILARTNAYRRNFESHEQVQGNSSPKYVTIIAPYLQKKGITKTRSVNAVQRLTEAFSKPKPPVTRKQSKKGTGLTLKNYKTNTDYIYWDNINELIDRLRLLISSTASGHTNHNNEIISIVEELREAKVIY